MDILQSKIRILLLVAVVVSLTMALLAGCGDREAIDLPEDFPELKVEGESKVEGEYLTCFNGEFGYYLVRMNESGRVVWYKQTKKWNAKNVGMVYNFQQAEGEGDVAAYYFEMVGERNRNQSDIVMVLLDENYEEIKRIRYDEGETARGLDKHDAIVFDSNNYIVCSSVVEKVDNIPESVNAAKVEEALVTYIQEIEDGKIKWEFRSADYPILYENKADKTSKLDHFREDYLDYMHFNSFAIDPKDGNLLVSFRNQCSVIKLNRSTGEIMWIMGGKKDQFDLDEKSEFACQHTISFTEEGNLLMYDNKVEGTNSRILELSVDEDDRRVTVVESIPLEVDTTNWGSVQKLDDKTYLVHEGMSTDLEQNSRFYELDKTNGERTFSFEYTEDNTSYWVQKRQ